MSPYLLRLFLVIRKLFLVIRKYFLTDNLDMQLTRPTAFPTFFFLLTGLFALTPNTWFVFMPAYCNDVSCFESSFVQDSNWCGSYGLICIKPDYGLISVKSRPWRQQASLNRSWEKASQSASHYLSVDVIYL